MKKVMVRGHAVLLARANGRYYAVDARCPHLEGDLTGIRLIIASRQHPPQSLKSYPVRVEGDRILIAPE
jgi:nitrite reductase/ring-hydroxylating ferredoxin subunit